LRTIGGGEPAGARIGPTVKNPSQLNAVKGHPTLARMWTALFPESCHSAVDTPQPVAMEAVLSASAGKGEPIALRAGDDLDEIGAIAG